MDSDNSITVTHFINPHLFWFKTVENPTEEFHVLTVFEQNLLELYKNKPLRDNFLRSDTGDKVAVNFIPWNKYIRAEILQKADFQQEEYIVWALDYGFPLLTKKEYIRPLPKSLQTDIGCVEVGGIANLYPAEQEYDDMEGNLIMVKKDKWVQKTCNMLEKLLADANSVNFIKRYQTENGHAWGDLMVVNHRGVEINARDYLLNTRNATKAYDLNFRNTCSQLKSVKIAPWLSNDRNLKMKFNNIKHNYIEHSKKMNAAIVDENAKRKVKDWQERNERKISEEAIDVPDGSYGMTGYDIEDVANDDSASIVNSHPRNYIGKAGILTKIKQQKYSTDRDFPPSALPESFEIGEMMANQKYSSRSDSGDSIEKISEARNKKEGSSTGSLNKSNNNAALIDFELHSSVSIASSSKLRKQNLFEIRKNVARIEKEMKYKSVDSSCADNKSESVKNVRVQQLLAMRKKVGSSSLTSSNESSRKSSNSQSHLLAKNDQYQQQDGLPKNNVKSVNNINFELKLKSNRKEEEEAETIKQIPQKSSSVASSVASSSANTTKEVLKICEEGFDNFTLVPAGFDISRLQSYKNEKQHWHRIKSTRNVCIPHDHMTSIDDSFYNNRSDQSSVDLRNPISSSSSTNNVTYESQSSNEVELKRLSNLSSELSISSNSPVLSQKRRQKKQLKSPSSQLLRIDKILEEHSIEKELGNKNILDLQLLNTSSSSQKPSNETSTPQINVPLSIPKNSNNKIRSHTSASTDIIELENKYSEVFNNETLIDVKHAENLPIVGGERKLQTNFIDHLVLAHSSIQIKAIENIADVPFLPEIYDELRQMRVNKVYRIQVYSWSHVLRNNSLFVVNPARSGKTWSYLPALCSLLCCRKDAFKPSYGPVAIILVASLKHAEMVNNYCRRLMNRFKAEAPTCIPSYGMRNFIETKVHLLNGCGILVATPANILRLLTENENEPLFDADRLQHIVIDDMDIMMSRSQEDFEKAYNNLFKIVKKSKFKKLSPQLIVTSRDWDALMFKFIQKSNQPLLLIGDFLEAAVYGRADVSVKLKANSEKYETILKFIRKSAQSAQDMENRTLIICNEEDDAQYIYKFLQDSGHPCLIFSSRSTATDRITIDEWTNEVSSQILICTDDRLCELKIQNVNNLIHYSLPTSWTQFTLRFSALARTYNNYINYFGHSILSTDNSLKNHCARSVILLDENNNLQLPRLLNFLRKHNQQVQEEIQAVGKRVLINLEEQRIINSSFLCSQLLEFGECDEPRCDLRHELTRFDVIKKSDGIPCSGEIRIHVLKVFSPTYFSVRLLQHKPPNSVKWLETRRSSESLSFGIQLNMHYSNENNLFLHWPPHVNDVCIYQYAENFRRARIIVAPTFKKATNVVQSNLKVTLRLIDDGSVMTSVKCSEIFLCDEKFKDFPPQAIDIRLMKVVPFDNERCWDSKITKQVQKWIMEDIKSNDVVQSSIDFSLANTIWVKNVVVMEKLSGIGAYCQVVNLKKSLIEKNFAVLYNGERKHIRHFAEEYNLLNSFQLCSEAVESDLDYQSCKDDSINLIKFSSSNDEGTNTSMESAESGCKQKKTLENKSNNIESIMKKTKSANTEIRMPACEEDWDENADSGQQFHEIYDPYHIGTVNKDKLLKEETWSQLVLNELVKVEIGDESENGNWENIFLQIIDNNSMSMFEELNELVAKHIEVLKSNKEKQKEIYDFVPLQNCIVKYNNIYLRAKVYAVYGENLQERLYRFFLCDYGCFTNAKYAELYNDFLYETTDEIINFTPYQAVHCTLAGIKWDRFTKRYQVTKDYLYACAVLECDSKEKSLLNLQDLPVKSFKILLYECEKENDFKNALLFNKSLVENGITVYEENSKAFLDYEIGIHRTEDHTSISMASPDKRDELDVPDTENKDKVVSYEQLINLIKLNAFDVEVDDILTDVKKPEENFFKDNTLKFKNNQSISESDILKDVKKSEEETFSENSTKSPSDKNILESHKNICEIMSVGNKELQNTSKVQTSDSEIDEQGHCTSYSNSSAKSSSSMLSTSSEAEALLPLPSLKALYKRPLTTWYQNDWMIFLSIYVPDVKDYFLEVSSKTVLFVTEIEREKLALVLNLLGSVDAKIVSHEIRGVNVVIRLKKIVFLNWPRLLLKSTKYSWLKYNFNAFDTTEMEYILPQQILHTLLNTESSFGGKTYENYNSDDDNEREVYQTYNPIQTNDDCDPFSAM